MDTKEKTIEESPEALLKQGQQTVEVLQSKIQRGTTQLDGWKAQLDAQQSYNEKLAAGLGSSKKGRKKKAAAKKAAAKTAAKAAKPAKKAKAAPAAKPAKKVAKKAGKKKAAKAAAAPVAKKGQKVSARKAVASGDLPSLTKRLIEVMGKEDVGIPEVITRLAQKGWTPDSKDLPTYISYMLSSNKETFERVSRGVYRVSKAAANGKGPKGAKGKVSPAKTNGVAPKRKKAAAAAATAPAAPEPTPSQAEQELAELGATDGTVPSNPFAL